MKEKYVVRVTTLLALLLISVLMLGCYGVTDAVAGEEQSGVAVQVLPVAEYSQALSVVESATWFLDNGLELSATERELIVGDVVVKVSIDESTVGCAEGRKNVFAQFRYTSDSAWCSAFDKYTGVSFVPYEGAIEGAVSLYGSNTVVYLSCSEEVSIAGQTVQHVVVNCQSDYYGVVFSFHPGDIELGPYSEGLVCVDEFSTFGNQLYFSRSEKDYFAKVLTSFVETSPVRCYKESVTN